MLVARCCADKLEVDVGEGPATPVCGVVILLHIKARFSHARALA